MDTAFLLLIIVLLCSSGCSYLPESLKDYQGPNYVFGAEMHYSRTFFPEGKNRLLLSRACAIPFNPDTKNQPHVLLH